MTKNKKCKFNKCWLTDEKFKDWLKEVENDIYSAFCKFCNATFSLSNMEVQALHSHLEGKKHKEKAELQKKQNISSHFNNNQLQNNDAPNLRNETLNSVITENLEDLSICKNTPSISNNASNITFYLLKDQVTRAEII